MFSCIYLHNNKKMRAIKWNAQYTDDMREKVCTIANNQTYTCDDKVENVPVISVRDDDFSASFHNCIQIM